MVRCKKANAGTIDFLKSTKEKLSIVKTNIPELKWHFDFPIESRLSKNISVQCDIIPVELIALCGELSIGIELSNYHSKKIRIKNMLKWKKRKPNIKLSLFMGLTHK